jgi:predicted acyltransferase
LATFAPAPVLERTASATITAAPERLVSLDAFRGLTMLLLISNGFGIYQAFKDHASLAWLANQFEHAAWVGCNLWDLIQPAFTFIVGVAMPLAFSRRAAEGASSRRVFQHVLWRAFALLVLSNVLMNWGGSGPLRLQFINVLAQIAFAYVLCALIYRLPFKGQIAACAGIIAFHTGLFYLFPGPAGPFDPNANIGMTIDKTVLGYNYSGRYTTINFLGNAMTVLFGVWAGMLFQRPRPHAERLRILTLCAAASFALGMALAPFIPMVKRLWTPSFLFVSTAWVLLALAACYWLVEVAGWRKWTFPAVVVGMNCIFIYSFSQVLRGWLSRGLGRFTGNFDFLGTAGAIPQNLLVMAVMWYLCYWLYQRKIFFKL